MRLLFLGVAASCVVLLPAVATAQCDDAAAAYDKAEELLEVGVPEGALELFRCAYEAEPNPNALYGVARCYVALGRYARAAEVYNRLLQNHPAYGDREGVAQTLTELRARIADLEEAGDEPSRAPTVIAGGNAYVFHGSMRDIGDIGETNNQTDVDVQATTRMTRGHKISWGVLASGLAITAVGAGLLIRGAVLYQDYKETSSRQFDVGDYAGWNSASSEVGEMAQTVENSFKAGWGLTISGLAMVCASIMLLVFLPDKELIPGGSGSRAKVHLSLTDMSFTGSF
jgi:hypothetical protein